MLWWVLFCCAPLVCMALLLLYKGVTMFHTSWKRRCRYLYYIFFFYLYEISFCIEIYYIIFHSFSRFLFFHYLLSFLFNSCTSHYFGIIDIKEIDTSTLSSDGRYSPSCTMSCFISFDTFFLLFCSDFLDFVQSLFFIIFLFFLFHTIFGSFSYNP